MHIVEDKEIELDKWQLSLDKVLNQLQECQKNKNLASCFDCKEILECSLRKEYVKSAYESMSKGSMGGFKF